MLSGPKLQCFPLADFSLGYLQMYIIIININKGMVYLVTIMVYIIKEQVAQTQERKKPTEEVKEGH